MNEQTLISRIVTVDSARGPIRRTVIAEVGDVIVVADPRNVNQMKTLGIQPFSIGFRRSDVLEVHARNNEMAESLPAPEGEP